MSNSTNFGQIPASINFSKNLKSLDKLETAKHVSAKISVSL